MAAESYLICLGGAGLFFWWMSYGAKKVGSLEDTIEDLEDIFINFTIGDPDEHPDPWLRDKLAECIEICRAILALRDRFQTVTYENMQNHLTVELPKFVHIIKVVEVAHNTKRAALEDSGKYADQLKDVGLFITKCYDLVHRWSALCGEIFTQLPGETPKSFEIMLEPLTKALQL